MGRNAIVVFVAALALVTVALANGHGADTAMLAGNHPPEAETLASVGNAGPAQPLEMEIRFALRNQAELNKLIAEQQTPGSPNYHKWLAAGEFNERFGPRQADVDAVADWLRSEGFTVESTSDGYIKFAGNVAQVQRSLSVRIARFGDGSVYANVNDPMIPARFAGVIGSVLGLDNMTHAVPAAPMMRIKPRAPSSSSRSPGLGPNTFVMGEGVSFGPGDIRTFYDETVASGQEGAGGCVAIVGISDFLDDALAAFQAQFMPTEAVFNVTRVLHGKNPGRAGDNTEMEAELDLEWSHAVAPGAAQKFHFSTNGNFIDDITGAVNDSCDVVSISFSFCGPPSGYASTVDALMKKAAAFGESVFVSTGDFGAAGNPTKNCEPGTKSNVSEMAADPNVTAVGGTQFVPTYDNNFNDVGYSNNEQVWQAGEGGATGGGASAVYKKPAYQSGPGVPSDGRRDIPDVALIAGSPGVFWGHDFGASGGIDCCIGGTSLATPIWAGFTRVISQMLGARPGPMNPLIYALANAQFGSQGAANGFHDITIGNNGFDGVTGFNAGPGYDQTTGWGTIDFDVFAAAVQAQPPPTPGPLTFPKTVSFGSRKVGAAPAKPKMIKLTNPAKNKIAAQITADAALMNGTDFTITSSACISGATVAAGKNCGVAVTFNPQSAGKTPLTDTLIFTDSATNNQQQVSLHGIGK